jgi:hypothetical protein
MKMMKRWSFLSFTLYQNSKAKLLKKHATPLQLHRTAQQKVNFLSMSSRVALCHHAAVYRRVMKVGERTDEN